jgi:hypothetical protein
MSKSLEWLATLSPEVHALLAARSDGDAGHRARDGSGFPESEPEAQDAQATAAGTTESLDARHE